MHIIWQNYCFVIYLKITIVIFIMENNDNSNSVNETTELTLEDIYVNLTLLSKIEVGDKLIKNGKNINIDTSIFPFITRWFYGHNRNDILFFIGLILNKAFVINDELTNELKNTETQQLLRLTNDLKNAINGLGNLKQTYHYDKLAQSEIDVMIENIRTKVDLNLKNVRHNSIDTTITINNVDEQILQNAGSSSNSLRDIALTYSNDTPSANENNYNNDACSISSASSSYRSPSILDTVINSPIVNYKKKHQKKMPNLQI
jgi:hypothetical protein